MSRFQAISKHWMFPQHQGTQSHPPQQQEPATVKAAQSISHATTGHDLTTLERRVGGTAVHYAFGGGNGMLYGALAELRPKTRLARGAAFGAGLWAVADELAAPAFGLTKPPRQEPLSAHLYGLASHLVYGLTTDAVSRGVRALL
jgi:putative membrane protein